MEAIILESAVGSAVGCLVAVSYELISWLLAPAKDRCRKEGRRKTLFLVRACDLIWSLAAAVSILTLSSVFFPLLADTGWYQIGFVAGAAISIASIQMSRLEEKATAREVS